MATSAFASPLAVFEPDAYSSIDFGPVPLTPLTASLSAELETAIRGVVRALPASLQQEATALLDVYPGPGRPFIGLFYTPVWSALATVPADAGLALSDEIRTAAVTTQALSLFLHLWDDHLTDGQMSTDVLRLHIRSLAWQQFQRAAERLAAAVPHGGPQALAHLVSSYVETIHRPPPVADFGTYCDRFHAQIGIWRVAPAVLGAIVAGADGAARLDHVICRFGAAWRVMDDLQDLPADLASGQENAVVHLLDSDELAIWQAARAGVGTTREAAAASQLWHVLADRDVVSRVLSRIAILLDDARNVAVAAGWPALAAELAAAARFKR